MLARTHHTSFNQTALHWILKFRTSPHRSVHHRGLLQHPGRKEKYYLLYHKLIVATVCLALAVDLCLLRMSQARQRSGRGPCKIFGELPYAGRFAMRLFTANQEG